MTLNAWIKSLLLAGVAMPGLVLSLTGVPAAAQSDQWNALYDRLIRLEAEVHARDAAANQPGAMQGADAARLSGLEEQVRQLVAQVQQMQMQMQNLQANLEFRLRKVEKRIGQQGAIAPQPSQEQWAQQQVVIPQQQADSAAQQQTDSTTQQRNNSTTLQPGVDLSQYQNDQLSQLAGQQTINQHDQGSQVQGQGPQILGKLALQGEEAQQQFGTQAQNQQPYNAQTQNQQLPFATQQQNQQVFTTQSDNKSSFSTQTQDQSQISQSPGLIPDKVETASLDGNQMTGSALANQIYQGAYQSLLSRQFGTAEAGFRTFLSKYPDHKLAGDAYYWLGETYFAQSDYKQAAQNFLQGYRSYPASEKAPDSLLKLGMSLSRLGQKPKACGAYAEVTKKYATAAAVRNKALLEMKRAGC